MQVLKNAFLKRRANCAQKEVFKMGEDDLSIKKKRYDQMVANFWAKRKAEEVCDDCDEEEINDEDFDAEFWYLRF